MWLVATLLDSAGLFSHLTEDEVMCVLSPQLAMTGAPGMLSLLHCCGSRPQEGT